MALGRRPQSTASGDRDPDPAGGPPADPETVARQICLHQLEHAPRTRAQLAAVLARKNVAPEVADAVLSRFGEVGLVDDRAFAQAWVSSRHTGRGLARRALSDELHRCGVDPQTVTEAVDTLDADTELSTARALVARRLAASSGLPHDTRVRRLAGMLARKGYPAGTAFRVVREALEQETGEPVGLPEPQEDGPPPD